jgi:hypothetical protein
LREVTSKQREMQSKRGDFLSTPIALVH